MPDSPSRNQHLRKRINVVCNGCSKTFEIPPYLKRETNYCSRKCYWDTNRKKIKRTCMVCNKEFLIKRYLVDQGCGLYCSRKCQHKTYPVRITKKCLYCEKRLKVIPSKQNLVKFCSKECTDSYKRDYLSFVCKQCDRFFQIPRWEFKKGKGNFCSRNCYFRYRGPSTLEEKMMRALDVAKVQYKREVKFRRFHVDFLIEDKKLVIECDGEHWHMRPEIQDRDLRKDKLLKNLGYTVLRFSGKEINALSEENIAQFIFAKI